jgi:hypothetical protein
MRLRCPGLSGQRPTSMVLACPNRAEEVEIFSDESTARCPKCKMPFYKKAVPTCAKWCKASAECMGLRANADNTPRGTRFEPQNRSAASYTA